MTAQEWRARPVRFVAKTKQLVNAGRAVKMHCARTTGFLDLLLRFTRRFKVGRSGWFDGRIDRRKRLCQEMKIRRHFFGQ